MPFVPVRNPLTTVTDSSHRIFSWTDLEISNGDAFNVFVPRTVTSSYEVFPRILGGTQLLTDQGGYIILGSEGATGKLTKLFRLHNILYFNTRCSLML